MSCDYETARDEMFTIVKEAMETADIITAIWPDVGGSAPTDRSPYIKVFCSHRGGSQESLSSGIGQTMYRREGFLSIEIYAPVGKGLQDSYQLGKVFSHAFQGKATASGVWFREISLREVGRDGDYQQSNILMTFTYSEIQ